MLSRRFDVEDPVPCMPEREGETIDLTGRDDDRMEGEDAIEQVLRELPLGMEVFPFQCFLAWGRKLQTATRQDEINDLKLCAITRLEEMTSGSLAEEFGWRCQYSAAVVAKCSKYVKFLLTL